MLLLKLERFFLAVLFSDFVFIFFLIDNQIGDKGAESIAEALKVNATLEVGTFFLGCIV